MSRIVIGPFNRVEGDLEVSLEVSDGKVSAAYVNSPLYRGFERILDGKHPHDALVVVPRLCGICSVSQSAAAAGALRAAMGLTAPRNGELASNLVLACENLADHLTHFYLFFMPDFARDAYHDRTWHNRVRARFRALEGSAASSVLPARAGFMHLMGLLAGKWPHTLSLQPGGSSKAITQGEKVRLRSILFGFRRWLETHFFGDTLETFAELDGWHALRRWAGSPGAVGAEGDLRLFVELAMDLGLDRLGRGSDRFVSYGAYSLDGVPLFSSGVWEKGAQATQPLDPVAISEDVSHAWMAGEHACHPWQGVTEPVLEKRGAYTWCKAPRLAGQVVEVGALARQLVDGHPLARDLVACGGGSVMARVLCRALEFALVLPHMERWVQALQPGEPFCTQGNLPAQAQSLGLVEAARGALGHWLSIRNGRISNYQIIAPTTWNFSPRDAGGTPGALEQALVGVTVHDGSVPLAVQHVVRSFDPCMVCTVH